MNVQNSIRPYRSGYLVSLRRTELFELGLAVRLCL